MWEQRLEAASRGFCYGQCQNKKHRPMNKHSKSGAEWHRLGELDWGEQGPPGAETEEGHGHELVAEPPWSTGIP